jgi:heat shock protein HslJ
MATCSRQEGSGVQEAETGGVEGQGKEPDGQDEGSFDASDLAGTWWRVRSMKTKEGGTEGFDETYVLNFESDENYRLRLKVNTCHGTYKVTGKGRIELDRPACTEKCCDPDRAKRLADLLQRMKSYERKDEEVLMKGDRARIRATRKQEGEY